MSEISDDFDQEYEQAVNDLVDAITESLKGDYQSDVEPFDIYIKKVQLSLVQNIKDFSTRFRKGHQLLIDKLQKK